MKTERHVLDKESYEASLKELLKDPVLHRKLIVEGSVLAATNIANLVLHLSGKLKEQTDLKHNKLEGEILRGNIFGENSFEISRLFRSLEDLKYKVVHGSSDSRQDVEKAFSLYRDILELFLKLELKLKNIVGGRL